MRAVDERAYARPRALTRVTRSRVLGAVLDRLLTPEGGLVALMLLFLGISVWWIAVDTRVVSTDTARHLHVAFTLDTFIQTGEPGSIITHTRVYPPLVHLVGTVATLIGGFGIKGPILAQNLVFMPLLALGCYGTGSVVCNRRAGLLAAVFALGAPIVISQLHVFMLDLPAAALTATSVWLLLASDRFARRPYALAAGVAIGLTMLSKSPAGFFLVGLLAVMLVRGGWRHPVNALACAIVGAVVLGPWYLHHADEIQGSLDAATRGAAGADSRALPGGRVPERELWTVQNLAWYGWAMANVQLLVPLTVFFGVGLLEASLRFLRRPSSDDYTPELVAGAGVGWVLTSVSLFHDVRYTLPVLVYVAVLGTAWIVRSPPKLRVAATVLLLVVFAVNTAMVNLDLGSAQRISFPGSRSDTAVRERQLTLVSPEGFVVNKPLRHQHVLELMRAAKADGARHIYFDGPSTSAPPFEGGGLTVFARMVGLTNPPGNDARELGPRDVVILRRVPVAGDPPPCDRLADGSGVYMARGYPGGPFEQQRRYCPPGFGGAS